MPLLSRAFSFSLFLEGFVGHAEQCNVRVRRYGGVNVPYGERAPYKPYKDSAE